MDNSYYWVDAIYFADVDSPWIDQRDYVRAKKTKNKIESISKTKALSSRSSIRSRRHLTDLCEPPPRPWLSVLACLALEPDTESEPNKVSMSRHFDMSPFNSFVFH